MSPDPGPPDRPRPGPGSSRRRARPARPARAEGPGRAPRPPARRRPPTFRWLALVLLPVLLVGAGFIDHAEDRPTRGTADPALGPESWQPTAYPVTAVGTAWYCAGGTATAGANADHRVYLFNPSDRPATAKVTVVPSTGAANATTVQVEPQSRAAVRLGDVVDAPYAAASVESQNSELVVQQQVSGSLGYDLAPCSSRAAATWYLPGGSTAFGNDEVLAIYNPFAADATVNISFVTDSAELDARNRTPQKYQGMAVPGRSLVMARVTDTVSRQDHVVATVQATSGSVVVDQLQAYGGDLQPESPTAQSEPGGTAVPSEAKPPPGLTLHPGVPVAQPRWDFPDGRKADGAHESILLFNPSAQPADVDVDVVTAQSVGPAAPAPIAPIEVTGLAPNELQVISVSDETRVPSGTDHSISVRSLKGVPIVAERVLTGVQPWDHRGAAATTGSPVMATRWLLPTGSATPDRTQDIALYNPGRVPATVTATLLDQGRTVPTLVPARLVVPAGGRATLSLAGIGVPHTDFASVVTSTAPVVVEQTLLDLGGGLGISSDLAIPAPRGLAALP